MSDLNEESVRHLSRLCRIEVPEEEFPAIFNSLKRILDYVAQLQSVDVSHLDPYSHVEEQGVASLREDIPGELLSRQHFLENAPDHVAGMVRVPPVLKQNL